MLKLSIPVIMATFFTLSSCSQTNQPWLSLQVENENKYEIALRTFDDSGTIAKPFEIGFRSEYKKGEFRPVLFSEHCRNVSIIAQAESLLIFYDEISLTHFSGDGGDSGSVSILMCHNDNAECARIKTEQVKQGARLTSVCKLP
jgi:hypothetical protein